MRPATSVRRARAAIVAVSSAAVLTAGTATPSSSATGEDALDVGPTWSVTTDGELRGDDIAQFAGTNGSIDVDKVDSVYLAGTSMKPSPVTGTLPDRDVFVSGYRADSGALRWSRRIDHDVADDTLAGFEVNKHNNVVYAPVNTGTDVVFHEINVSNGSELAGWTLTGARGNDTAISTEGGIVGLAGTRNGRFFALSYQSGSAFDGTPTVELSYEDVPGEALSADIGHQEVPVDGLYVVRNMLVTGRSSGFGTGGDIYTAAYDTRTGVRRWSQSWASPDNRADVGLATDAAYVTALAQGVGFVAGRTFTPERGFDIVVLAYDLETGTPLWSGGQRVFDGQAAGDDEPLALQYSDATSTLYVLGTSERGVPHGTDVVTIAYDALTGRQKRVAYATGDAANGDDLARSLAVSPNGERVVVAADVVNTFATGGRRSAVFAFDSELRPAGRHVHDGDRAGALAFGRDGTTVFHAGSQRTTLSYDSAVAAFATSAFALQPVVTAVELLDGTPLAGDYTDAVTVAARLTEADGTPVPDAALNITLADTSISTTTDAEGIGRATIPLTMLPSTYQLRVAFAGASILEPTSTAADFVVRREAATMNLARSGSGSSSRLTATLVDADDSAAGIAGGGIRFFGNGDLIGGATTDPDGQATVSLPSRYRGPRTALRAEFGGDERFAGTTAAT